MEAEEYGIAVTKGNKELVAQINKALASLKIAVSSREFIRSGSAKKIKFEVAS